MTDPFRPLKNAFGRFATGVALAGCRGADGAPVMLTVNSFASVSLTPPLVLWCIEKGAHAFPAFNAADAYSINILKFGQQALSERFAGHRPAPPQGSEYEVWETGAPILKERLAAFDCRVRDRHPAGDHVILIAEVLRFEAGAGVPLLYFTSRYVEGPEAEQ
jgi:flavin reductase (DIM6/NTAB) family NADH-FMN oxidoreductase RutF